MNFKDFKQEIRMYGYIKYSLIPALEKKAEEIFYEETGVKGVNFEKIPTHPSEGAIAQHRLKLTDMYEQVEQQIKNCEGMLRSTEEILNKLPKDIKRAVVEIYAKGKHYEGVSKQSYISVGGLYKAIEREVEKL